MLEKTEVGVEIGGCMSVEDARLTGAVYKLWEKGSRAKTMVTPGLGCLKVCPKRLRN